MEEPDEESNSKEHPTEAMSWMLNRGLKLGKRILVAGFVASSAPVVIPPLVIVSAIGLAVSVPYGLFLASHACTEKLMSKLLPRYSPPLLFWGPFVDKGEKVEGQHQKAVFFEGDIDVDKEEKELPEETNREIKMILEMDDVENVKEDDNNMKLGNDHGQGVMKKDKLEISQDAMDVIESYDSKGGNGDYIREKEKAPAGKQTDVKLESENEAEVEGLWTGGTKGEEPIIEGQGIVMTLEDPDKIGDDIEEFKTPFEVTDVIEGDIEEAELKKETKGLLETIRNEHIENMDPIETEAESGEPIRRILEEKYVDDRKVPEKQMEEPCGLLNEGIVLNESIATEPVGFSLEGRQEYDTLVAETPDADAREIADESGFDMFDAKCIGPQEYSYTVDLYEESNVMANDRTDPILLPVLALEHMHRQPEYSSSNNIITSSSEVIFNEEKIWKQIHALRMIVGYEGTPQASCIDELKALYMFTGVEPPTLVNNSHAEINDKLHFLMSIVGVKSNMA